MIYTVKFFSAKNFLADIRKSIRILLGSAPLRFTIMKNTFKSIFKKKIRHKKNGGSAKKKWRIRHEKNSGSAVFSLADKKKFPKNFEKKKFFLSANEKTADPPKFSWRIRHFFNGGFFFLNFFLSAKIFMADPPKFSWRIRRFFVGGSKKFLKIFEFFFVRQNFYGGSAKIFMADPPFFFWRKFFF
jgi:hypothetical protein